MLPVCLRCSTSANSSNGRRPRSLADERELNRWLDGIVAIRKFETVAINATAIAFAGLYVHGDLLDHCGTVMLGVSEKFQGRGIGSTLMSVLLATAKMRANLRRVQLTVLTGNTAAIRLYRSFGFQFEGLHRSFSRQGNDYVDAYSMAVIFGDEPRSARQHWAAKKRFWGRSRRRRPARTSPHKASAAHELPRFGRSGVRMAAPCGGVLAGAQCSAFAESKALPARLSG